jgi:mannan polymerase II complex ANP1 subunit
MAKRMQFSVVGLPHYTIWHLYEPSVEDMKHMEEMEKERKEKERKEKAEKERLAKINEQFENPSGQWDQDKSDIRDMAKKEYVDKDSNKAGKKSTLERKPKGPTKEQVDADESKK